jgi:hypothetical protein
LSGGDYRYGVQASAETPELNGSGVSLRQLRGRLPQLLVAWRRLECLTLRPEDPDLASDDAGIWRLGRDDSAVSDVERSDFGFGAGSRGCGRTRREPAGEDVVEAADERENGECDDYDYGEEEPRADAEPTAHRIE